MTNRLLLTLLILVFVSNAETFAGDIEEGKEAAKRGDSATAIQCFSKAIAADPENISAYEYRANAYGDHGDFQRAISDFHMALEKAARVLGPTNPALAEIYNNRGVTYYQFGKLREAISDYQKAISLDGKHPDAHSNLAWVLATSADSSLRDPKGAVGLAKEELRLYPSAGAWDTLAAAFAASGDFEKAQDAEYQAIQIQPSARRKANYLKRAALYKQHVAYVEPAK